MARSNLRASVLLLAYNQEDYIRAAVECAFAQDAVGLEIILSDDCSGDATFGIMREMADAYDGPHEVRLNRNRENLGVNNHINHLVEMAGAEICVPFPADDTSMPNRVSRLLEVMAREDALLVHSDAETIDGNGNPATAWHKQALFYETTDPLKAAVSPSLFLGATSAYRRELWRKYGPLPDNSKAFEDLITGFRAALEGRVSYVDEKLVCYRQDTGISNADAYRTASMAESRMRRQKLMKTRVLLFNQRLKDARSFGLPEDHEIVAALKEQIWKANLRGDFYTMPWGRYLLKYGSPGFSKTLSELNYIIKRK